MDRIDHPTAETDKFGVGKNGFTEGQPGVTPATVVTAAALDSHQEEIVRVIEAAGLTPDREDLGQMLEALSVLYGDRIERAEGRIGGADGSEEWIYTDEDGDPEPRLHTARMLLSDLRPHAAVPASYSWDGSIIGGLRLTGAGFSSMEIDLPFGSEIVAARVLVQPGAARTGDDRFGFALWRRSGINFGSPSTGALVTGTTVRDDGTSNLQTVSLTGLTEVVGDNRCLLVVQAGNTAGSDNDNVYAMEVDFLDPGPRNF